eukprot:gnl/MRDRNA2_/MRDRNA2_88788_c0_seq1.p1 gnl/MRDRNA2_/MRDRNA2_88788_c0~~gnl/MRDRNA2_/MRDRNA2_88788_c0_seq1.p1  ORF type:complete len:754 (-),score=186.62 gnl/MRDRNA2_/MRDRNA2_88788_c0_seq1:32-2293(-)
MGFVRAAAGISSGADVKLWPGQPKGEYFIPLRQHFRQSILAGFQLWEPGSEQDFWSQWGLAVFLGIGALAIAVVVGVVYAVVKYREAPAKDADLQKSEEQVAEPRAQEPQHVTDPEAAVPSDSHSSHSSTKQQRTLKHRGTMVQAKDEIVALASLAQRVGGVVGPKLLKSQALRGVLSKRLSTARGRAEQMLMNEVNGMAAEVCEIIDAPEIMLLKDWEATTTNFPPLPALVSGLIAPLRLQSNLWSNLVHIIGIVPVICLCGWALYNDWALDCTPIPSLRWWVIATLWVGGVLVAARTGLLMKVNKGLQTLQSKANETHLRSELRLAESGTDFATELHLNEIKELLIDHSVLASHALKVDASINASVWNPIVGVATVLWVCVILWNLWEAIMWSFVPGRVAFHDAARGHENFCASWHIVMVARIVAVISVLLLLFNLFAILMWVLQFVMQSDELASKIHEATRRFDRNTTGLPVSQLLVRLCIMPSAELEEVRIHHVRQKYLAAEEDLRRTQKNMENLTKRRDKQALKLQKLETIAAQKAKTGKNKDPLDQTLEEIEAAIRSSFDVEAWHAQGLDAVRRAKQSSAEEEEDEGPAPPADSLERLVSDLGNLASRVQESQEFHKAAEAAQSAASFGTEKMQEVIVQAQQVDTAELAQASKKMLEQATEKGKSAMEQAQQSGVFQQAQAVIEQAQQSETFHRAQSAASTAVEQAQSAAAAAVAKSSQPSARGAAKKGDGRGSADADAGAGGKGDS